MDKYERLNMIKDVLNSSWSKKTCYPPDSKFWNRKKPHLGQCAVTALIIQDYLGGDLLYNRARNHYWNRLPNGEVVDLTIDQFENTEPLKEYDIKFRNEVINKENEGEAKINSRYRILKKKVDELMQPRLFFIEEVK